MRKLKVGDRVRPNKKCLRWYQSREGQACHVQPSGEITPSAKLEMLAWMAADNLPLRGVVKSIGSEAVRVEFSNGLVEFWSYFDRDQLQTLVRVWK
jgi:hypothetical protein